MITIISDTVLADGVVSDEPLRIMKISIDGNEFVVTCAATITAADYLANNEEYVLNHYHSLFTDVSKKIIVAPDFQFGSPKKPKNKQEAKERMKAELDKYDTSELKSVAEIVTCLLYLVDNLKDSSFK